MVGLAALGVAQSLPAEANYGADKADPSKQQVADRADPEDKVEASVYSRVMRVRDDIAMTNEDLAALGLTEAQAEDVLARLVEWVEKNQSTMIRADNHAENARQQLVDLERRIRVGEATDREAEGLTKLEQAVTEAEAACRALCTQAGTHAVAPAPGSVQSQWQTAQAYAHLPLEIRHLPGLDDRRVRDLMESVSRHAARSDAPVVDGVDLQAALPLSTTRSMDEVRRMAHAHLPGVRAAEQEVLPVPSEMRDDEAGMMLDDPVEK